MPRRCLALLSKRTESAEQTRERSPTTAPMRRWRRETQAVGGASHPAQRAAFAPGPRPSGRPAGGATRFAAPAAVRWTFLPVQKCEQNDHAILSQAEFGPRKEYSFLSIEKTIGNSMSLARARAALVLGSSWAGLGPVRLLLEDAPRPSRRVRDPAVGCLGAGMYQRGRVHGAPPLLAPLRSRRRRLRPAPNYGAAPQAGGLERPAGCTDGLCVCAQLDLLYDVIRIQAQNQATILADVQALCVRQAPLAPLKPRRPCREAAPEPRLLLAGLHGRGHVLHVGVGDPGNLRGRRHVNHG